MNDGAWSNEEEMFALVHQMRTRGLPAPASLGGGFWSRFCSKIRWIGRSRPATADYLWNAKQVVPFLKVDKGLAAEKDGVQLMKPIPDLAALLGKASKNRIFGTKMRSVIKQASSTGVQAIVDQQFQLAESISAGSARADHRAGSGHPLPAKSQSGRDSQCGHHEETG